MPYPLLARQAESACAAPGRVGPFPCLSWSRPIPASTRSFLAAMAEFEAEGQGGPDDDSNTGPAIRKYARRWADLAEFAR
jgi:hypothetical protein